MEESLSYSQGKYIQKNEINHSNCQSCPIQSTFDKGHVNIP